MKTYLLFTFILAINITFAQIPTYFDDNQEWLEYFSYDLGGGNSNCIYNSTEVFYVNGDSIINNISYKRIGYKTQYSYFPMSSNPCPADGWVHDPASRFMRQSNDSIFLYAPGIGIENLFISYNLAVGDTFTYTNHVSSLAVVQSITTTMINGQSHRVFHTDTTNNYYVIEGVGHFSPDMSAFFDLWGFGQGLGFVHYISCYAQNGTTVWTNPYLPPTSCDYLDALATTELQSNPLEVYPNPTSDFVNITGTLVDDKIEIVSLKGDVLITKKSDGLEINIDLTELSDGFYLVRVKRLNGDTASYRISKQ